MSGGTRRASVRSLRGRAFIASLIASFLTFTHGGVATEPLAGRQPTPPLVLPEADFSEVPDPTPDRLPDPARPPVPQPTAVAREFPPLVSGVATWYRWHTGEAAAGPALRVGDWRGRIVTVTSAGQAIRVRLTDWCACPGRLIDLDVRSFATLAPPSMGVLIVDVRW